MIKPVAAPTITPVTAAPAPIEPDRMKALREIHGVQGTPGNWDSSPYMRGLYNGLELALAIMENRDPVIKEAPPYDDSKTT